jgi:hypothetical protein
VAKHTISGYITWQKDIVTGRPRIGFVDFDPRPLQGTIEIAIVCQHDIVVEVPDDFSPASRRVAALQRLQQSLADNMRVVNEQLASLTK